MQSELDPIKEGENESQDTVRTPRSQDSEDTVRTPRPDSDEDVIKQKSEEFVNSTEKPSPEAKGVNIDSLELMLAQANGNYPETKSGDIKMYVEKRADSEVMDSKSLVAEEEPIVKASSLPKKEDLDDTEDIQ